MHCVSLHTEGFCIYRACAETSFGSFITPEKNVSATTWIVHVPPGGVAVVTIGPTLSLATPTVTRVRTVYWTHSKWRCGGVATGDVTGAAWWHGWRCGGSRNHMTCLWNEIITIWGHYPHACEISLAMFWRSLDFPVTCHWRWCGVTWSSLHGDATWPTVAYHWQQYEAVTWPPYDASFPTIWWLRNLIVTSLVTCVRLQWLNIHAAFCKEHKSVAL